VIVVFCKVPEVDTVAVSRMLPLLSEHEREKALRFRFDRDRTAFSAAHVLLRRCLERITGRPDRPFGIGAYGKPDLNPPWGSPPLQFNITHTRGLVACALARGHDVGVDAEADGRVIDYLAIAEHHFAPAERRALALRNECDRPSAFRAIWTMKEAVIKATGLGLEMPLDCFTVEVDQLILGFAPELGQQHARWRLERNCVDGASLAVAVRCLEGAAPPDRFNWWRLDYADLLQTNSTGP
jgi:4'-phosphopantetheinyl transferase